MSNNQDIPLKVRKKIGKVIKKIGKLKDRIKQAKEMADMVKVEKLGNKIKKLEEDAKKMIELKDGKLKKVEDEQKPTEQQVQVDEKEVISPQPNPFDDADVVQSQDVSNRQQVPQPMPVIPGQQPIQSQLIQSQHVPSQEMVQQPQVPSQQPVAVEVSILLISNISVKVPMEGTHLQGFLQEIATAIDSQASIQIGNQLINGRNIIIVQF